MTTENNNRRPQWPPVVGIVSSDLVSREHLTQRTLRLCKMEREQAKQLRDEWTEVGRQMRVRREAAKISLRHLAECLGISAPYLGDMERGFRRYQHEYVTAALEQITANKVDMPSSKP